MTIKLGTKSLILEAEYTSSKAVKSSTKADQASEKSKIISMIATIKKTKTS